MHRLFHVVPWLWRVHAVHHSDTGFDLTAGVHFHPGEIVVSLALKAGLVVLLGAGPWVVLVFETTLSLASLFTHGNLRLPSRLETGMRTLIVTPEMHRTHHSVAPDEHNRNFGFFLSVRDRAFGTYRARSRDDPASIPIGLAEFRSDEK